MYIYIFFFFTYCLPQFLSLWIDNFRLFYSFVKNRTSFTHREPFESNSFIKCFTEHSLRWSKSHNLLLITKLQKLWRYIITLKQNQTSLFERQCWVYISSLKSLSKDSFMNEAEEWEHRQYQIKGKSADSLLVNPEARKEQSILTLQICLLCFHCDISASDAFVLALGFVL